MTVKRPKDNDFERKYASSQHYLSNIAAGDMQRVKLKDGRRRRLLHNEAARLQSFPDWYEFIGNETQRYNQIGNAVPPLLAYQMALALKECYKMDELYSPEEIIENNLQPNQVLSLF